MSKNYDNWERLVAAVLKKEELWQLFHEQSRSPSLSSESSSGFSFSSNLNSSLDDIPISFTSPRFSSPIQSIVDEDQSPVKNVSSTRSRRRDLKIEVPNSRVAVRRAQDTSVIPISNAHPKANWPNSPNRQSYPLPLPPVTNSNSSPVSRHNSAATSPSTPPERGENVISPVSPWKKGKFIARGAFGNVYTGFNSSPFVMWWCVGFSETGEMCAMKEVTLFGDDAKSKQSAMQLGKQLEREIALLSSLKHPNLVQYYGSETLGDNFYIYLEYVSGGSIYSILQQYGILGESAIRSYTQQILSGLAYLHSKSIAHRDIKGGNILVDPNGSVKLANFGIAKNIADQSDPSLLPASPYWMAPEVIMNSNVRNRAVDIWSLGWTVLEMATSRPPLSQYDWMVSMFKDGNHKDLPIIPDRLSAEGKDFVRRCLQWNPVHRANASQLLEHPFVKNVMPLQNPPPLEKRVLASKPSGRPASANAVRSQILHQLESGRVDVRSSAPSNYDIHPSDIYTPRNIPSPVSPIGSPLRHPRSPHHLNDRQSPPHISSSHNPSTRAINPIPYHHLNNPSPKVPNHRPVITSPSYWDPNILRGPHTKSHPSHKLQSRENDTRGNKLISTANQQLVLADRVSKKLLNAL